jgi:hypothetical protein
MPKIKLSIIIVHYKNKKVLFDCLKSITNYPPNYSWEAIVVDNDEKKVINKSLLFKFPFVKYIKSTKNIGYGAGNNLGVSKAKGRYLLILNPDTKIIDNSIDLLVDFLDHHSKTAIVAPILVNKQNLPYAQIGTKELDPLTGIVVLSLINTIYPNNFVSKNYWFKTRNSKNTENVDVVAGSAFLIRNSVFKKVGGFDEKFFLYFEENDLCKRIKKANYEIVINKSAKIRHLWGKSTKQTKEIKDYFSKSRFYYFKKHYGIFWAIVVDIMARISRKLFILIALLIVIVIFVLSLK